MFGLLIKAFCLIAACSVGQTSATDPADKHPASSAGSPVVQTMTPMPDAPPSPPTATGNRTPGNDTGGNDTGGNDAAGNHPDRQDAATPLTGDAQPGQLPVTNRDLMGQFEHHLPDPERERQRVTRELAAIESAAKRTPQQIAAARRLHDLLDRITRISRPQKLPLTLEDALHRTLQNSYAIRVSSYNPAINTTRVVEAQAAFDAVYFVNINNRKVNQPTASQLVGSNIQDFTAESGIRKLLPTGMQVQTTYNTQRLSNDFRFQQLNPQWTSNFIVQFTQPLMRGFGTDVNRAQIRVQKLNRQQSMQQFKRDVRDVMRNVEEAYWRLVQARRALVVSARLLVSFQEIYNSLLSRKGYDVYEVQLSDSKARLESSKADFLRRIVDVRNAEDQLIALMNDPEINLADEIEIVPTDFPSHLPIITDRLADIQLALDHRAEVEEARIAVNIAKIQVGVAKNQALPRMDVSFTYTVAGLGASHEDAFSEVTKNDFNTYVVGFNFEIPIGNRGLRAALARSKLEHGQSMANLKNIVEQTILDVNRSVREVNVTHDQIEPTLQAANATEQQVRSIIARAERKDFLTLNNELNTRTSLAQNEANLLSALVDYAIAIVDVERAKGTLLQYNGITLDPGDHLEP